MNESRHDPLAERTGHLVLLAMAPAIWMVYFLMVYITAAVWCAKVVGRGGSLAGARVAIDGYTILALLGMLLVGWSGYTRYRYGTATRAHDSDTPEDRHRFLGFATLLLAGLGVVATLYVAMPVLFFRTCE